ncbi:hypothetical protein [Tenacibaculum ovolyticum]|uniref:hypothetical protein n=1 Tax=Tenacibaculum ovolyticum TaxID=104270 RepID=UPI0018D42AD4|nr:hypothetical protein [Tenacibaculum ovolyticum]
MTYKPDIRINNPIYLLRQVEELLKIARKHENSSSLIYATLECRIALELMDLNFLLHSVKAEEREQIIIDSKPKNGIDRVNSKIGSLKHKYQFFLQAICEILGVSNERYDYKKSKDLQYKVSTYIHSYHMNDSELQYNSDNMQNCLNLIIEVDSFIKSSMPYKNGTWTMLGMEISSMPKNDREIFEEWKISSKMTYNELKEKLSQNHEQR